MRRVLIVDDEPIIVSGLLSALEDSPLDVDLYSAYSGEEALNSLAGQVRQALTEAEIPFDRQDFNPHITLVRKPTIPDNLNLSEIHVPQATMVVKDVCLYRSDHGEQGMEYTVIGRSKQGGE